MYGGVPIIIYPTAAESMETFGPSDVAGKPMRGLGRMHVIKGVVLLGLPHVMISTPTLLRASYPSHSCLVEVSFLAYIRNSITLARYSRLYEPNSIYYMILLDKDLSYLDNSIEFSLYSRY